MAKKVENKIRFGYKAGSAKRCNDCNGNPEKLKSIELYDGRICSKCYAVFDYRIDVEDKEDNKKQKENKTRSVKLEMSKEEVEKLHNETEKEKVIKKESKKRTQTSINFGFE